MLFRVCEHYYDEPYNISDICIICYEHTTPIELSPMYLSYYLKKTCKCDSLIHKNCLDIWIHKNNKCPICRNVLVNEFPNKTMVAIIYYANKTKTILCFIMTRFIRLLIYFFAFYTYIELYLYFSKTKHL